MASLRDAALFLDVDLTLTTECVQATYAKCLGVHDEYRRLEGDLQEDRIDSRQFGSSMVQLLAERCFTESKAAEFYKCVEQQPWCPFIRSLNADLFLVSAGPSYYVKQLAADWSIPSSRILCSNYEFRCDTGVIHACCGVTADDKAQFVSHFIPLYRVTVGVGDNPQSDGLFLSLCDLAFLIPCHSEEGGSGVVHRLHALMTQAGVSSTIVSQPTV